MLRTVLALFLGVSVASADTIYGVDGGSDSLYTIDLVALTTTLIGPIVDSGGNGFSVPTTLAARPSDGQLFFHGGTFVFSGGVLTILTGLSTVDPVTAVGTRIGGGTVRPLAFDDGDVLYTQNPVDDTLGTVDQTTGIATTVGGPVLPELNALDFNSADGFLYATSGFGGATMLHRISTATGMIAASFPAPSSVGALLFDSDGTLYGFSSFFVFTIDPNTGSSSFFGTLTLGAGTGGPQGVALVRMPTGGTGGPGGSTDPIPEPGTFALVALVLGVFVLRRRG